MPETSCTLLERLRDVDDDQAWRRPELVESMTSDSLRLSMQPALIIQVDHAAVNT